MVNQNTSYVGHFVRVPYEDYPNLFKKAMLGVDDTLEVDQMRCVIYGNAMFIANFARDNTLIHAVGSASPLFVMQ